MGWLLALTFGLMGLIAVVVLLAHRSARRVRPTESDAEDFLAEYFALEEFTHDADLRERLERLRGQPELR
jgi:hypothetical protein